VKPKLLYSYVGWFLHFYKEVVVGTLLEQRNHFEASSKRMWSDNMNCTQQTPEAHAENHLSF